MDSTLVSAPGWMDKVFSERACSGLVWLPEVGIGYYPVKASEMPYDADYFSCYQERSQTEIGRALTRARVELVARHYDGEVLDVGIGCGQFVESRPSTFGFDVNPVGVEWLKRRGKYKDFYDGQHKACSFWDSLEHIADPAEALRHAGEWAFVSLPIYEGSEHILRSKHFRKTEHFWYHTDRGLKWWFSQQGFDCVESNEMETAIGREGIGSYAFRRFE